MIVNDFDIYIPNEIFDDLNSCEKLKKINKIHLPFAYSYYFYINYLYRYCKFYDQNGERVTQEKIKAFLGYSPTNKKIDYIVKKGGVLDNLGYTLTTNDYPIQWGINEGNMVYFLTVKDLDVLDFKHSDRNFKIKKPIKAFYRDNESQNENYLSGTFYEVFNTHRIPFGLFLEFMANDNLQTTGFYIYAYLKYISEKHYNKYQASYTMLANEIGLSESTLKRYIKHLEICLYIEIDHKPFDINLSEEERESNIYYIS